MFRVLPRKDAAAVFEYLSQEDKESLLKAMAQEDVATLLNNMAPDDRTLFLEELPAEPGLVERWQLDDDAPGLPALGPVPVAPEALPPRDPRVIPVLFGAPDEGGGPEGEDAAS